MAMIHQELDAVLFGRDRIVGRDLDHLQVRHVQLKAAGSALIGADGPRDDERRLLGQLGGGFKRFGRNRLLENHTLNDTRPVPDEHKLQASFVRSAVDPSLDGHLLAYMLTYSLYVDLWGHPDTSWLSGSATGAQFRQALSTTPYPWPTDGTAPDYSTHIRKLATSFLAKRPTLW